MTLLDTLRKPRKDDVQADDQRHHREGLSARCRTLGYMEASKTEAALPFFETDQPWTVPAYIEGAIG
jgi:hypothetical protein